jgi:cytochrome c-type biogenesis protein
MNRTVLRAFSHSLAFVLGFSIIFVILGLPANLIGEIINKYPRWFGYVGGVIVIILGLHILLSTWGLSPLRFLYVEKKAHIQAKSGYLSSLLIGITFAAGWTPCLGPILAVILTLAASSPGQGVPMMIAYSLGLAIPFLLVALLIGSALGFIQRIARYVGAINVVSSLLLIAVGFVLFFGFLSRSYTVDPGLLLRIAIYVVIVTLVLLVVLLVAKWAAKDPEMGKKMFVPLLTVGALFGLAVFFWGVAHLVMLMGETTLNAEAWLQGAAVNLGIAFVAGLASFLSPCVLPMVPTYILIIAGLSFDDIQPKPAA